MHCEQLGDLGHPAYQRMEHIFFNGWAGPIRTAVIGIFGYAVLVVFLRISGNRTLSKMNAFDFLVTVALGSTLATLLLSEDVSLIQGSAAFAVLIGLQFVVTWSSVRWPLVRKTVTGEPVLLSHDGQILPVAMRYNRVTENELRAAVREAGLVAIEESKAIVLETDGTFSVMKHSSNGFTSTSAPALVDVKRT